MLAKTSLSWCSNFQTGLQASVSCSPHPPHFCFPGAYFQYDSQLVLLKCKSDCITLLRTFQHLISVTGGQSSHKGLQGLRIVSSDCLSDFLPCTLLQPPSSSCCSWAHWTHTNSSYSFLFWNICLRYTEGFLFLSSDLYPNVTFAVQPF